MPTLLNRQYQSKVLAKDSKDNAVATATANSQTPNQNYNITGIDASYSVSSTSGLLQLQDGATVIYEQYVHGHAEINFDSPIEITMGNSVSAVLAASGTAGTIGKVNLRGYLY